MNNCDAKFWILTPDQYPAAQAFYAEVGYHDLIARNCTVIAAQIDGRMVGVARLTPENEVIVLRGMMIENRHQRHGIGTLMLRFMEPHMSGSDVWCLPHGWLEGFYGQIGFVKIDPSAAPAHLQERLAMQKPKHPQLITMVRSKRVSQPEETG